MILNYEDIKKDLNKNENIEKFNNYEEKYIFQEGNGGFNKYIVHENFKKMSYFSLTKSIDKEIKGKIEFIEPNLFILKKGSEYFNRQQNNKTSFGKFNITLRDKIKENKWSKHYGEYSILTENVVFYSPSGINNFITGSSKQYQKNDWIGQNNEILNDKFEEYTKQKLRKAKNVSKKLNEWRNWEEDINDLKSLKYYGYISSEDQSELAKINDDDNIKNTTKKYLYNARVGQGKYREDLLNLYKDSCMISEVKEPSLLIASHIVPWANANNNERLDKYNGLLLLTGIDKLFDKYFISFDEKGLMVISKKFKEKHSNYKEIISIMGVPKNFVEREQSIKLSPESQKYMKTHFQDFKNKLTL